MPSERTMFHPLALIGVGTPEVESLGSYFRRLAFHHQLKPVSLIRLLLEKMPLSDHLTITPQAINQQWNLSGCGVVGSELAQRLSLQTGQRLEAATLYRFSRVLSPMNFASKPLQQRYCPLCVKELGAHALPYGRLLWDVQCVHACPVHGVRLRDASVCGADSSLRLPSQKRPQLSGVCRVCGSVSHGCITTPVSRASDADIWIAEQVAALIAMPNAAVNGLSRQTVVTGLKAMTAAKFEGKVVPPSLMAGLARATVSTWIKGQFMPSLPGLAQLCLVGNGSLTALLAGRYECAEQPAPLEAVPRIVRRTYVRVNLSHQQVRSSLVAAAASPEPPSLKKQCQLLGIRVDSTRRLFTQEVESLKLAHRLYLRARSIERQSIFEARLEEAARALEQQGKPVQLKGLQAAAGMVIYPGNNLRGRAVAAVLSRRAVAA